MSKIVCFSLIAETGSVRTVLWLLDAAELGKIELEKSSVLLHSNSFPTEAMYFVYGFPTCEVP
jgi:hypothetical protein